MGDRKKKVAQGALFPYDGGNKQNNSKNKKKQTVNNHALNDWNARLLVAKPNRVTQAEQTQSEKELDRLSWSGIANKCFICYSYLGSNCFFD